MKKHLFVSHISEERKIAERMKEALSRDFLGLVDVFVSSDTESIAAGEEWLRSVEKALLDCTIFVILCSPESIRRPWCKRRSKNRPHHAAPAG
jgi:TIR domain